jgi:hypothetical protein
VVNISSTCSIGTIRSRCPPWRGKAHIGVTVPSGCTCEIPVTNGVVTLLLMLIASGMPVWVSTDPVPSVSVTFRVSSRSMS